MTWDGPRVTARTMDAATEGLALAAEHLLGKARAIVPLETGQLSRSGRAEVDRAGLLAAVSFDTVYAVRQHEELTWRHPNGRQAKYLETPMRTEADIMGKIIATAIARALK